MNISINKYTTIFVLVFIIIFGIIGSIYNKKTSQLWFLKYSIGIKPDTYIYSDVIDKNIGQLSLNFFKYTSIIDFTKMKTYRNEAFLDKNVSKVQISPASLVLHVEGNLDNIEKKIETIIFKLNKYLKKEINLLLNTYLETAVIELNLIKEKKIKSYQQISNYNNSVSNIDLLNSIKKNIGTEKTDQEQLELYLDYLNTEQLLQMYKNENVNDRVEINMIKDAKKKLLKQDIYYVIDRINKYNLKPNLIVTIVGFGLFGFFISTSILFLIKLISKRSQKILFEFFNIK